MEINKIKKKIEEIYFQHFYPEIVDKLHSLFLSELKEFGEGLRITETIEQGTREGRIWVRGYNGAIQDFNKIIDEELKRMEE